MKLLRFSLRSALLFLLIACTQLSARSQTGAYPSLLWEISGNGLSKPSYLYGTMHVSKKVAFHLSDAFFEGLKSAEVVALETNPETWLSEIMSEGMSMMNRNYLNGYFMGSNNNGFYEKAFDFTVPRNKFIKGQIAREPENVNSLLYRFNGGYSENFEEQTYLDLFIFQAAKKSNRKVVALEDFKTSMEMLVKASMPDEDGVPRQRSISSYAMGDKIEDAYRNGDLDALDSLNKLSYQSKNFEKYMLTERNVIMANHMDSLMKIKTLFTAIGAAHLPGNAGVISLLRKMGYTVKPVMSSVSKKSIKEMGRFENEHTPLTYQTVTATDSSFHVEAPGKLFAMAGFDQMDSYLYTDMVNGSYYMVKRIRNYGLLMEQDEAFQVRRIDSLLYESIPGKILKKEAIVANNGDPGFEITNRTRRGDLQRYRIFVSNQYISIFKVAGTGDYVKSPEIDRFFKSITFKEKSKNSNWVAYAPASGGYELSLPANYAVEKPAAAGYQQERVTAGEGYNFYMFTRSLLNDYYYIEEDTFELSQLSNEFCKSLGYELQDKKTGTYLSYPSVDVTAKKKSSGAYLHFRIVMKGPEYFLLARSSNEKQSPLPFFNSLKFKAFKHDSMATYKDTSFYYSVTTDYKERQKSVLEGLANPMRYASLRPAAYASWNRSQTVESPGTSESVEVNLMKCNDYRMDKSSDAFWKTRTDYYLESTSLHIREKKRFEKNGLQGLDLILSDTNSFRQIKTRMLLKSGLLYTLQTTIDSVSGPSPWITTFYDTFTPADTVIGRSIFEDKTAEFLENAVSKDSATREKVNALASSILFEDKHAPMLIKFIGGPGFSNVSSDVKVTLLGELGSLKDPAIAGFLKNEYQKYTDSASLQLAILRALASQRTEAATKAFMLSLAGDSPLSNNEYAITGIFSPFYDTLKLARTLFPQLLDIARYPEYKAGIYSLMSVLLDSSMISPKLYETSRKDMLRQANEELKRQFTQEENSQNNSSNGGSNIDYGNYNPGDSEYEKAAMDALFAAAAAEEAARSAGYNVSVNSLLVDYCNLLAPSYADPSVKAFFSKAMKTKSDEFRLSLIGILLKNKQEVPDTMINNLAKDLKTRVGIYTTLKNIGQLSRMSPEYRSQQELVKAKLFGDTDIPSDSIRFIGSRYIQGKEQSGYVYFYRSANKDGSRVKLNFLAYQPKDSTMFERRSNVSSKIIYANDDIDKEVNEICYELSMNGRKRVKTSYWNSYDDYSYEDDY